MAKSLITRQLEAHLYKFTGSDNWMSYGCFEVTLGISGDEIVDFITTDAKNEIRCYEIKVSKADLNSGAKKSFVGDFNYFVMTRELWNALNKERKWEAYYGIGVLVDNEYGLECVRKAKRKPVHFATRAKLMGSMVRSMSREIRKFYKIKGYWEAETK